MARRMLKQGLACFTVLAAGQLHVEDAFEQFQSDFNKHYKGNERSVRFASFRENYEHVVAENSKGKPYKLGLNEFSDISRATFSVSHLGMLDDRVPWDGLPRLGVHEPSSMPPPASVNWVEDDAVTPVKNQAQCGSCWAFAGVGAIESAWAVATKKLVSLSEQQLVDCSKQFGNNGCGGGLMDNSFRYLATSIICTEQSYPYTAQDGVCKISSCTAGIPLGTVVGYKDVAPDDLTSLMDAVAQQPVAVTIEADRAALQFYKSGVLTKACGNISNHGVLVVGYGTENGTDYWLIKNSWGPSWGLQGYAKIERGLPGHGKCGIKSRPSYPVVKSQFSTASKQTALSAPPAAAPFSPTHYEAPPCRSDEVSAEIQGANGTVCAPHCDTAPCPADVPAGTRATPACVLQDAATGNKYCALTCILRGCPPGAQCVHVSSLLGICIYREVPFSADFKLKVAEEVVINV